MSPRLVTRALQAALKLWLRSQTDTLDELHIQIQSSDRQLLGGTIPEIAIAATGVVYDGLHLSQITLQGRDIRTNLPQILRGQPFRFLDPIQVEAHLHLQESDLNASLQSPLIAPLLGQWVNALFILLAFDIQPMDIQPMDIQPMDIQPQSRSIPSVKLQISDTALQLWLHEPIPMGLQAHLDLEAGRWLYLRQVQWLQPPADAVDLAPLEGLKLDLGSDVQLLDLSLQSQQVHCTGQLLIRP